MKTKPIDYTGCHPAIKEQLQKGNAVFCRCWNYEGSQRYKRYVIAYTGGREPMYHVTDDKGFHYAEPIETKRVLKDPVSLMKAMVEHNWEWDDRDYYWWKLIGSWKYSFSDWNICGGECEGFPDYFYEEIEV